MSWLEVDMDTPVFVADVLARLLLACVFGGAVGWDREVRRKAAGLRTHMMVALGAAVFIIASLEMLELSAREHGQRADPTRVIQGIAGGIGFLGAGQIIQSRGTVKGITTAAGIWVVGAIGVACGAGHYVLAGSTALFTLLVLSGLGAIERRLVRAAKQTKE